VLVYLTTRQNDKGKDAFRGYKPLTTIIGKEQYKKIALLMERTPDSETPLLAHCVIDNHTITTVQVMAVEGVGSAPQTSYIAW
jgi:hypothetical protein